MQIDKRTRRELKQYFVANAIPTDHNFEELIDGMLNQKEDGIARLPNDALSIEAARDPERQGDAIHFYKSFADDVPTWVLSLNPRQSPADAATARAGFTISDRAGNNRLFIDEKTGRLGVGTIEPVSDLTIRRDAAATVGPGLTLVNGAGGAGAGSAIDFSVGANRPALRLQSVDDGSSSSDLVILTKDSSTNELAVRVRVKGNGDVALGRKLAFRALHTNHSHSWLQLNPDKEFDLGVSTPGVFAYGELQKWSSVHGKTELRELPDALATLEQLNPILYERSGKSQAGFIAEEVREIFAHGAAATDDFFAAGIHPDSLLALAIAAIQELSARVKELSAEREAGAREAAAPERGVEILREGNKDGQHYVTARFCAAGTDGELRRTVRTIRLPAAADRDRALAAEYEVWTRRLLG